MKVKINSRLGKTLIILSIFINIATFCFIFYKNPSISYQWYEIRPTLSKFVRPIRYPKAAYRDNINSVTEFINSNNFHSESDKYDFIRHWIHINSIHKEDKEHKEYAFNTPKVIYMLWETYSTNMNFAHLSCGPRTYAMKMILNELGIESRMISIFSDDFSKIMGHTFLEVFNKESNNWEIQDPEFDISYIDNATQLRISSLNLIFCNLDSISPISKNEKGWVLNDVEHLRKYFFGSLLYANHYDDKGAVIIINTDRFDAVKIFEENGNISFYEYANMRFGNPIFVENKGF